LRNAVVVERFSPVFLNDVEARLIVQEGCADDVRNGFTGTVIDDPSFSPDIP
jgi:hypothetical protein